MNKTLKQLTLAAMFIALGLVLPFLTGQIPQFGNAMLPMHLPVFLCGLILGWKYGGLVGFALPVLRYALFGMPPIYPTGTAMAFELATYGLLVGLMYRRSPWKCTFALYKSIVTAMIAGRVVWGVAQVILLGLSQKTFTWSMFMAGAFLNAIPGIIIQLLLIPAIMVALNKTGLVTRENHQAHCK